MDNYIPRSHVWKQIDYLYVTYNFGRHSYRRNLFYDMDNCNMGDFSRFLFEECNLLPPLLLHSNYDDVNITIDETSKHTFDVTITRK